MANICCDDVYFYTYTNPTAIQRLWYDLETSIICSPNPDDSWFGNLFKYVKLPTADLVLRGCVTYMEQNDNQVFLELETAWSPLYDAYASIAAHYGLQFVIKSVEPGSNIYINSDDTKDIIPEKYIIRIYDDQILVPSGDMLSETLEDCTVFASEQALLDTFHNLGYQASCVDNLNELLLNDEIEIHEFLNPYITQNKAA